MTHRHSPDLSRAPVHPMFHDAVLRKAAEPPRSEPREGNPRGRRAQSNRRADPLRLIACPNCHAQYDVSDIVVKTFPCRCGETLENRPLQAVDAVIHRCGACGARPKATCSSWVALEEPARFCTSALAR